MLQLTLPTKRPENFCICISCAETTQFGRKIFLREGSPQLDARPVVTERSSTQKNTVDTRTTHKRKRIQRRTKWTKCFLGQSDQNIEGLLEHFTNLATNTPSPYANNHQYKYYHPFFFRYFLANQPGTLLLHLVTEGNWSPQLIKTSEAGSVTSNARSWG